MISSLYILKSSLRNAYRVDSQFHMLEIAVIFVTFTNYYVSLRWTLILPSTIKRH